MIVESFQDIIPLLLSMSILLTVASYKVLQYMERSVIIKQRMLTKRSFYLCDGFVPKQLDSFGPKQRLQVWLTCFVKRKESPEDDGDYTASSFKNVLKRGGQKWNSYLYSHVLKGKAFYYSSGSY
ncbi:hypothetical protein [Bacillus sp. JCM 19034]|uniref:hypothetical protein n=1 Tax=Bacillus sp. JCM 19034 TaxID=1481928 RepID=UPI00078325DC|nr:hypothetical protein [Bacillus sp. JCM 19034]